MQADQVRKWPKDGHFCRWPTCHIMAGSMAVSWTVLAWDCSSPSSPAFSTRRRVIGSPQKPRTSASIILTARHCVVVGRVAAISSSMPQRRFASFFQCVDSMSDDVSSRSDLSVRHSR